MQVLNKRWYEAYYANGNILIGKYNTTNELNRGISEAINTNLTKKSYKTEYKFYKLLCNSTTTKKDNGEIVFYSESKTVF